MERIELGEDDGIIEVEMLGVTAHIDLFALAEQHRSYYDANKDKPLHDYVEGLVEWIIGHGFPRCSHRMALLFIQAMDKKVGELKKKDSLLPGSPASTTSTPSS